MDRTVVIAGLGTVCGLGVGVASLWDGLCAGRTALRRIQRFDPSGFSTRLGSEARDFSGARDWVPKSYRKAVKVMARDIELAVCAAKCAVEDAGLVTRGTLPDDSTAGTTYPGSRMGCQIGAGLIAAEADELTAALATAATPDLKLDHSAWGTARGGKGAMNNLPPLWLLKYLPNMLACHVTIIHGAEGPSNTITCAEASGLLSIGESVRVIQRGDADLCFSGGAEAPINPMRLLRWEIIGRLAATGDEDDGSRLVRPFDPASPGSLLGEAGGIVILEDRESAAKRGARVYAQVAGFGAAHSSPGDMIGDSGRGIDDGFQFAIENALADAGLSAHDIDAIVPHGLGVPTVDAGEAGALRAVFGSRLEAIPIVTISPNLGDALAGNGGLAAAVASKCLSEQRLPARVHAGSPANGLQAGAAESRPARLRHILVASGAIGGQNAALILRAC